MPAVAERQSTLVSQLEETLCACASHVAVAGTSATLTYRELDQLSARCATVLQKKLENRFAPIALMMSHDAHLIAAIIGILRSGGFYFVLNHLLPPARLREVLDQIRPRAVITDDEHVDLAREVTARAAKLFLFEELLTGPASFSPRPANDTDLFALFYTSGSVQKPRPIVYRHGGTNQSVRNHSRSLQITTADRMTLLAPCSAAASVSSIFGALVNGATLCPFNPLHEGLHRMRTWIDAERISIYHSVPSLFRRFAEALGPDEILVGHC